MPNIRTAAWVLAVTCLAPIALAEEAGDVCTLPSDVETELSRLSAVVKTCGTDPRCLERAEQAWKPFLERYSRSFLVHRGYATGWPAESKAAHELENQRRLESAPLDPLALTLRARDFLADRPEEARALLGKALEIDPGYAWAHFTLAWHYEKTDKERARAHVVKLAEACPDSWRVAGLLQAVGTPELGAQCASVVRRSLPTLPRDRVVRAYSSLWTLAFRGVPPAEHEAIREQIRAELAQVASWKLEDSRDWWSALEEGYKVVGDTAARDAIQRAVDERYPCEPNSVSRRLKEWTGGRVPADAAEARAQTRAGFAVTSELVGQCPDSALAWYRHFRFASSLAELSDEEIGRIADAATEVYARGGLKSFPSPYAIAADLYLDRGVRLERVKALVERDRADAGTPNVESLPEKQRASMEEGRRRSEWLRKWRQMRADAQLGRLADAGISDLEKERDAESEAAERDKMTARLAWLRGDRAAGLGSWADAFAFYHQASGPLYGSAVEKRRDAAWKRAGGTADGLAIVVARAKETPIAADRATKWTDVDRRLPEAQLDVVGGGKWSPEALKGRRTLIGLWATWCGPCIQELPMLQKLHERLADRKDVAVLTLNADQNPGLVEPLLREKKYTFPTVFATDYLQSLGDVNAFPTNWIVDLSGAVRLESVGFGLADGEGWLDEVLKQLEQPPTNSGS